ncbi:hypothetical protein Tco_0024316 [Tanacetum coccineum]
MNTTSRESDNKTDERIDKLADQLSTLVEIVFKKVVTPALVKAVEETCVTCGGAHSCYNGELEETTIRAIIFPKDVLANPTSWLRPHSNFRNPMSKDFGLKHPISGNLDVSKSLPKPRYPYLSRLKQEKSREQSFRIKKRNFSNVSRFAFDISFAVCFTFDARFAPTIRSLCFGENRKRAE